MVRDPYIGEYAYIVVMNNASKISKIVELFPDMMVN